MTTQQREQWSKIPAPSRAVLENSAATRRRDGPLTDSEFKSLLSSAGTLARFHGRTSAQGRERIAAAALRVEMSPTDLALIEKSLTLLGTEFEKRPEMAEVRKAIAAWRAASTPDTIATTCLAMECLIKAMPEGHRRDAMARLALQIRSAGASALKEQFKQQLHAQLAASHVSGGMRQFAVGVEIGPAAGLFGLELGSATLRLGYEFSVSVSDSERLLVTHKAGAELKLGAKAGIAGMSPLAGSATAAAGVKAAKVFPSVENCVNYYADSLLAILAGEPGGLMSSMRGAWQSHKADVLEQYARTQGHRLQHDLQLLGVLQEGETLALASKTQAPPQTVRSFELSAGVAGRLGASKQAALAGSLTLARTLNVTCKYVPLLDTLRQEPALLHERRRAGFSIALRDPSDSRAQWRSYPGEQGLVWAGQKKEELAAARAESRDGDAPGYFRANEKVDTVRLQLQEALFSLFCEYQNYCAVLNRYDGLEAEPHAAPEHLAADVLGRSATQSDLQRVKHGLEAHRGAHGRGQYLQAVIAAHVLLCDLYQSSFGADQPSHCVDPAFDALLQQIESEYRQPSLSLSQEQVRKYLSLPSMTCGYDTRLSANLKLELGLAGGLAPSLEAEVRHRHVVHNANPDSDGEFIEIGLRGQTVLSPAVFAALQSRLARSLGEAGQGGVDIGLADLAGELKLESGMALELSLGKGEDGTYRLRYARAIETAAAGGRVSATSHGVKMGVGAGMRVTTVHKEWLGSDTLAYVKLKYNGTKSAKQPQQWQRFVATHEDALCRLLAGIGDKARPVHAEAVAMMERLDEVREAPELEKQAYSSPQARHAAMKRELWQACERLRANPLDAQCRQSALTMLESVLEAQYEVFKQDSAARFHY
ncbi:hypothetical protein [Paludibacterium yongneupense]|uniref:hypothetical protein n=1 Tax=Paludibacterium yongneupense TaxID=400061 RepID=UPI0012EC0FBE|nr:hypothetical protein [Paludibacterium yongneupense]